jgi:4-amino-4-deoxy-L-arabinose transferase-like glycosyltransferase
MALAACGLFILLACAVIPYAGVQNDEALFAAPLYEVNSKDFCLTAFHHQVPLMVMSYVGTLKTLLYIPILSSIGPSVWSVRLPMVLAGALTVFLFFKLASRSAGSRAGVLAALLLAADPSFLLTDTFDWGPVALQHLLLVTGCLLLVRFGQFYSMWDLAWGFFFFGLAVWDKAVFSWALAGLVAGTATSFWPELRRAVRPRFAAVAVAAFLFGALPFVIYNLRHINATLQSTAHVESVNIALKLPTVRSTLNGSGLFGYLTAKPWEEPPKPPRSRRGRAAVWIEAHLGERHYNGMEYVLGLALLAVPWWWPSRAARFSLVFMVVSWMVMALTRDAGAAIHHSVLLWPFPHLFIAVTAAALPWPRAANLAVAIIVGMNLLVVNQYLADFERSGPGPYFTDALFPLSDSLSPPAPGQPEQPIYLLDWGILNTLALFHQGRLVLRPVDGLFSSPLGPAEQAIVRVIFEDPNAIFIGHVPAREVTPGGSAGLERAASAAGLRKQWIRTIHDSNGVPVFEIHRLRPGP